ncbi:MAG TPA: hypothetical protein VMD59_07825, partial [Acidimicrobiales bacterium]|nr:hypothetical protein [Acidimicrobiales bacterium]
FFRYFPTKADVVITDEFDPMIIAAFRSQPAAMSVIAALRAAFRQAFESLTEEERNEQRERTVLNMSVPELRGAMLDQLASAMVLLGGIVAERTGRAVSDPAVRTLSGAVVGAAMAVMLMLGEDPSADFVESLDDALSRLEGGLAL